MVKTPERALGPGRQSHARNWIRKIRKTRADGLIEIRWTVRLHRDNQREIQPFGQWTGQAIRRNGRNTDHSAALATVGEERVGRNEYGDALQLRMHLKDSIGKGHYRLIGQAGWTQRSGTYQWKIDFADVGFATKHRNPLFANERVVGEVWIPDSSRQIRHGSTVNMHEKRPSRCVGQPKVSKLIRDCAHILLQSVRGDDDAGQRHVDRDIGHPISANCQFGCEDAPAHDCARKRGEAQCIEVNRRRATGNAVTVGIDRVAKGVTDLIGNKRYTDACAAGKGLEVKQRRLSPVR